MQFEDTVIKMVAFDGGFVILPNSFAQDHSMSHTTRAALLDTFSRPANWQITVGGLMAINNFGRPAGRRVINEAEREGYLYRKIRRIDGKYAGEEYYISPFKEAISKLKNEEKCCNNAPQVENLPPVCDIKAPQTVLPAPVKMHQQKKDLKQKKEPPLYVNAREEISAKWKMNAALDPIEAKAQQDITITADGEIEASPDFSASLAKRFPHVDQAAGLAIVSGEIGDEVHRATAKRIRDSILRRFGYLENDAVARERRNTAIRLKDAPTASKQSGAVPEWRAKEMAISEASKSFLEEAAKRYEATKEERAARFAARAGGAR